MILVGGRAPWPHAGYGRGAARAHTTYDQKIIWSGYNA